MGERQKVRVLEVDMQMEAVGPVDALMVGGRMSVGQEQEQPRLAFELECHSKSEDSELHCGCGRSEQRH